MSTSAHGAALSLMRPFGTAMLTGVICPPLTLIVWRKRKPSVSFTTSIVLGPSLMAIGPAVEPIGFPFSKTCNSMADAMVRPPNLGPATAAAAGPAGVDVGVEAGGA